MAKKKIIKRDLSEFKSWLSGLSEFQSEGWVPSSDQWEHIKASIAAIKEQQVNKQQVISVSNNDNAPVPRKYVLPVQSSLDPVVPIPGDISTTQHIDMRKPEAIKTDIDTSNGNYTSDFE